MQNFERRAIATARHLTQRSKQVVSSVSLPLSKVPGMVQPVRDLVASSVTGSVNVSPQTLIQFIAMNSLLH